VTKYVPCITVAVLLSIVGVLPLFISSYYVGLLTLAAIYGIFAMSLDLLIGYTGLLSLGHAAFFGISAYVVALINVRGLHNFWVELLAGLVSAAILAAAFGLIALRGRKAYFLLITVSLSLVVWGTAFNWNEVTGGADGIAGICAPSLGAINFSGSSSYFYFTLVFSVIAALLLYFIVRSPFGYILQGIRESEIRISCLGYNAWRYKYIAFIVAGAFAGLAGILFVWYNRFAGPSALNLVMSAEGMLMVILGGTGTLFGPVLGAIVIVLVKNITSSYTEHWTMILGVLYILVVVLAPHGVYPMIRDFLIKTVRRRVESA
jgi:branched-chain amino acid transport system permease protein